jgi:hypothetical protein
MSGFKFPVRSIAVAALTILSTAAAQAKQLATFDIAVGASNGTMGRVVDVGAAVLYNWNCSASTRVELSETLRNHKGQWKQVPRQVESNYSMSLFESPSLRSRFEQKLDAMNPVLTVNVMENCTRSYTETTQDASGKNVETPKTDSLTLTWACKADMRASAVNRTLPLDCPTKPSFFTASAAGLLLAAAKQKQIIGGVRLVNVRETYEADLCGNPNARDVRVLNITQGVGGHIGEDDFAFHLKINGRALTLRQGSGILDADILVCGANQLEIQASAEEEDLIWNDQYSATNGTLVLEKSGPASQGNVKLERKSFLGMVDRTHELLFTQKPRYGASTGTW